MQALSDFLSNRRAWASIAGALSFLGTMFHHNVDSGQLSDLLITTATAVGAALAGILSLWSLFYPKVYSPTPPPVEPPTL